jgi:hypothetical protein
VSAIGCPSNEDAERRAKGIRSSGESAVDSPLPLPGISLDMHAGDDSDPRSRRDEIGGIRKPAEERLAGLAVDLRKAVRGSLNLREADIDSPKEVGPEPH